MCKITLFLWGRGWTGVDGWGWVGARTASAAPNHPPTKPPLERAWPSEKHSNSPRCGPRCERRSEPSCHTTGSSSSVAPLPGSRHVCLKRCVGGALEGRGGEDSEKGRGREGGRWRRRAMGQEGGGKRSRGGGEKRFGRARIGIGRGCAVNGITALKTFIRHESGMNQP
eukprot:364955-Chlamydomonas_euryale.AAC.10